MPTYLLKPGVLLRGWKDAEFCVEDERTGKLGALPEPLFRLARMSTGILDSESVMFSPQQRKELAVLARMGIVVESDGTQRLEDAQRYRTYNSNLIYQVHWSVTGRCNYRCRHCFLSAPSGSLGELPLDECLRIVDQMAECGVPRVSLTGGECLLRKDFWQIVDALGDAGIHLVAIYSNGKLVTSDVLDKLEARGLRPEFSMSFDGVGWHDWLRGVDGAEKDVVRAFKLCQERGFPTTSEMCLHRYNLGTIRESVALLGDLGVSSVKISPAVPLGEWLKSDPHASVSWPEYFDAVIDYLPSYVEDGMPTGVVFASLFAGGRVREAGGAEHMAWSIPSIKHCHGTSATERRVCDHAKRVVNIEPDGTILPCVSLSGIEDLSRQFPNVVSTNLRDAVDRSYLTSFTDATVRDYLDHNPGCLTCEHMAECGAGCRGLALQGTNSNDILGKDEVTCMVLTGGYAERVREVMEANGLPEGRGKQDQHDVREQIG